MYAVSSSWDAVIRGSHVVDLRVDAYRAGVLVASDLPVEPDSGSLTVDGAAEARRSVQLTIADPSLVPTSPTSILTPHGTELRISQGFRFPSGIIERVPLGRFRIDKPSTPLLGAVQVSAVDYSRLIAEDLFINAAQSVTGNTLVAEIRRVIQQTMPTATVTDTTGDTSLAKLTTWEQGSSRWEAVKELALALNADVAPNVNGEFIIRRFPAITNAPVWTINVGESGVLIGGSEDWDREGTFNAVTVRSEPTDGSNPVQATVYDLDAASATFWNGPFGHRPTTYSSPLISTVAQCYDTGTTILNRSIASARSLRVACVPNPALDWGDVITVVLPGLTANDLPRVEKHMVRSLTLPLGLGAMEIDLTAPRPTL